MQLYVRAVWREMALVGCSTWSIMWYVVFSQVSLEFSYMQLQCKLQLLAGIA